MNFSAPFEQIYPKWAEGKAFRIFVLRVDQNHPQVQGNKLYKLRPIIDELKHSEKNGLITFGGAYSNHLYATAAAGKAFGFKTVGIVRGTWANPENETLKAVQEMGMQLHFVSAVQYQAGAAHPDTQNLIAQYPNYVVIPEGALTKSSIRACTDLGTQIRNWLRLHKLENSTAHVWMAIGTGGTAAGVLAGLEASAHLHIVAPTIAGIDRETIKNNLKIAELPDSDAFTLLTNYTFGGFAQRHQILDGFIRNFHLETGILPDPIYTGKVFYACADALEQDKFDTTHTHVLIHTGGLQGWNSTNRYVIS
jgi:1-aminocyclopropane-1-carboxylate deaminase